MDIAILAKESVDFKRPFEGSEQARVCVILLSSFAPN